MNFRPSLSTRQKVNIAKALNRCIRLGRKVLGRPMQGEFVRGGLRWSLDLNEGIDFAIYLLGAFERDLRSSYRKLIAPGSTVLDIGANIGAHTLPLAHHVGPNGKVIAIEATDYAFAKLNRNLALNPHLQQQCIAAQALLVADLNSAIEPEIASSWPLSGEEKTDTVLCGALRSTSSAEKCTLDSLVNRLNPSKIDWVKLDVDGHELSVLQGAQEMLRKHHPSIFMEFAPYCYRDNPDSFHSLIESLRANGYSFYTLPRLKRLPDNAEELTRVIPRDGSINVLARSAPL
jgi:FkbM family methyltransferase